MKITIAWLVLTLLSTLAAAAETTYWLPRVETTPTSKTYTYDVRVPDFFVPWLLERTERGGGEVVQKTIDGQIHDFVRQDFTWKTPTPAPAETGQIRIDDKKDWYASNAWRHDPKLKEESALIAALNSDAVPMDRSKQWYAVQVLALRSQSEAVPGLTFTEEIPPREQALARMLVLSETTRAGEFYPSVQVPGDLEAFRQAMLTVGNIGRRDPEFRKERRYAADLSGEYATTDRGREKIYKHSQTPPYFPDLVLDERLNEACQFQAEYQAFIGQATHDGPRGLFDGADLSTFGKRLDHFAPGLETAGEGAGGPQAANAFPEDWMNTETHYRPWFSIGHDVQTVGLGIAKGRDGWFACKIGGVGAPPAQPAAQPSPVASVQTGGSGADLPIGKVVGLESSNYPGYAVRHEDFKAVLREGSVGETAFRVVTSAESPEAVRFEARTHPGHLLRHFGFRLRLDPREDTPIYLKDSSFFVRPALNGDTDYSSFESVNFPGRFLRHSGFEMWLHEDDGTELFHNDASFKIRAIP